MNKIILIVIFVLLVTSCSNGKVDEGKIDAASAKLKKTIEKGTDSAGAKLERLKHRLDSSHRDTLH